MRESSTFLKVTNGLLVLAALAGVACLLAEIGWPVGPGGQVAIAVITHLAVVVFLGVEALRLALAGSKRAYLRENWLPLLVAALALVVLLVRMRALQQEQPGKTTPFWVLLYLGLSQGLVLLGALIRALRLRETGWFRKISPGWLLIGSFAVLVVLGTLLLKMPLASHAPGLSWRESLFTSTSAVCVTGLTVVDTATRFTFTGQVILLTLIQIGGLGVMTLSYFLAALARQGFSLRDRILLKDLLSEDNIGQVGAMLGAIVSLTLAIEAVGALALFQLWAPVHPDPQRLPWDCVFHAVSAFCNAGFSTFSSNLAEPFTARHWPALGIICGLIVAGGLGFPVLRDLLLRAWRVGRRAPRYQRWPTHHRLVLRTTAWLVLAGAALLSLAGSGWSSEASGWDRVGEALFNSITARTAGFNVTDLAAYGPATGLLLVILMFVGGSPTGTAGGIKTTTLAVAVLNLWRIVRKRDEVEVAGRHLPEEITNRAFGIVLLSASWIALATLLINFAQPELNFLNVLFETTSAFCTVGLSRATTSLLSPFSQLVIIATMFVGRVGILTCLFALVRRADNSRVRLPSDQILLL